MAWHRWISSLNTYEQRPLLVVALVPRLQSSTDEFVRGLFPERVEKDGGNDNGARKKQPATGGRRLRAQCDALVRKLMDCTPHYVRCLKPNDAKQARVVDAARAAHQAQYLGLLENIKVTCDGVVQKNERHIYTPTHSRSASGCSKYQGDVR